MPRSSARISLRILLVVSIGLMSLATVSGTTQFLPNLLISSTIPSNADLNPYGVAFVPEGFPEPGLLAPGDVLVSNFNDTTNTQGTGTTIIKFTPNANGVIAPAVPPATMPPTPGNATTFFTSGPIGLTTALGVLKGGFVLVGNLPTSNGAITSGASLQVIDRNGNLVGGAPIVDSTFLDSPWDLTINDDGNSAQVFVSNVVSGTVSRLDLAVNSGGITILRRTQIATGYLSKLNNAALITGPTGLAYDANKDVLYVASTADNLIFAISDAGHRKTAVVKGTVVFSDPHLRGPLALAFAPNGNLLTANGDAVNGDLNHPSEIVEFTKNGKFIGEFNVDAGQGGAFGLATSGFAFNFAAVDDNTNSIWVLSLAKGEPPFATGD